jgi:hypothetical protein
MTYKIKLLNSIAIFSFLFISCEDPSTKKEPFPIADINFDYLQGSNKLFVSAPSKFCLYEFLFGFSRGIVEGRRSTK